MKTEIYKQKTLTGDLVPRDAEAVPKVLRAMLANLPRHAIKDTEKPTLFPAGGAVRHVPLTVAALVLELSLAAELVWAKDWVMLAFSVALASVQMTASYWALGLRHAEVMHRVVLGIGEGQESVPWRHQAMSQAQLSKILKWCMGILAVLTSVARSLLLSLSVATPNGWWWLLVVPLLALGFLHWGGTGRWLHQWLRVHLVLRRKLRPENGTVLIKRFLPGSCLASTQQEGSVKPHLLGEPLIGENQTPQGYYLLLRGILTDDQAEAFSGLCKERAWGNEVWEAYHQQFNAIFSKT